MFHDYYSVEHFMRERQREILSAARLTRQAQMAARRARSERAAEHPEVRFPSLLALALDGLGKALVTAGHRLEYRAPAAQKAAGFCDQQPTAAGC